jgi:hypothetical protein
MRTGEAGDRVAVPVEMQHPECPDVLCDLLLLGAASLETARDERHLHALESS